MITRTKETQDYIDKGIQYIVDNNLLPGCFVKINDKNAGIFVLNLADFDRSSNYTIRQNLIKNGPIGEYNFDEVKIFEDIQALPRKFYLRRTVFSIEFGSINQILVMNLTGDDLVWINV